MRRKEQPKCETLEPATPQAASTESSRRRLHPMKMEAGYMPAQRNSCSKESAMSAANDAGKARRLRQVFAAVNATG
jgi:hypothetical protein